MEEQQTAAANVRAFAARRQSREASGQITPGEALARAAYDQDNQLNGDIAGVMANKQNFLKRKAAIFPLMRLDEQKHDASL